MFLAGPEVPVPPLVPPVPWTTRWRAFSFPSFVAPALILWIEEGRLPPAVCSSLRSRKSLTGAPASLASCAAATPSIRAPNLAPKPPPMYSVMTLTLEAGIFRVSASSSRTTKIACVDAQTVSSSPSHCATRPCGSRAVWIWTCVT